MAFADYAAYKAAVIANSAENVILSGTYAAAARPSDSFRICLVNGAAPAAPTTAAAPTRSTAGAFNNITQDASTGILVPVSYTFNGQLCAGAYILYDRLSHQGALSGIVTTAQTTNLPTTALTRYTSGEGVFLAIDIHTTVGSTGTTVTATYTNQAGTGSRVTPAVVFGGTGFREANRRIILPLQGGDTGVRSVESVTVLATTGTAGAFGITLFKPIAMFIVENINVVDYGDLISGRFIGGLPEIVDNACLALMTIPTISTTATGSISVAFAEC
jgi:hypothetical protein